MKFNIFKTKLNEQLQKLKIDEKLNKVKGKLKIDENLNKVKGKLKEIKSKITDEKDKKQRIFEIHDNKIFYMDLDFSEKEEIQKELDQI